MSVDARPVSARAAAIVLAVVLTACSAKSDKPRGAGDSLRVGASISLTGSLAREGLLTRQGYELCQDVVNGKGGVKAGDKSLKLDIAVQDDTSKPDTAGQLVDQFNDKGIKLILGPYGSAATEAVAAVVERNQQVMADSAGADDKIFEKGYTRTFAVLSPASEYASAIVDAIAELANPKPKTVAFLSADDGFSKTVAQTGALEAQKQGMRVLATEFFPNGATDVSSALTKVKGLKPDLIIGSVHLAEGVAIIKQAKELGVKPAGGFGETVAPPTPDFVRTLAADAEGVLGSSQWVPEVKGDDKWFGTARDYSAAFQKKFGAEPAYHNAQASAACLTLVLGVEKADSIDPGRVREAVASIDTQSFFGPIKFDPTGKNVTKKMAVIQIQGGQPITVWPKEAATKALVWPGSR